MTCDNWTDEGFTEDSFTTHEPLFYYFYVLYNSTETRKKQIVYFDRKWLIVITWTNFSFFYKSSDTYGVDKLQQA